jgi:carboxymethylenebutenolidase
MDQKIIDLYDEFTHGGMNRRDFLDRLAQLAGGASAALSLLPALQNNYAQAQIIGENDDRLSISRVEYDAAGTKMAARSVRVSS